MKETKTTKKKERKEILANLDRLGSGALGGLEHYMMDREDDVVDGMEKWDIGDPVLLGYARGFEAGFKLAACLVNVTAERAMLGEEPLDDDIMYHQRLDAVIDAEHAEMKGRMT